MQKYKEYAQNFVSLVSRSHILCQLGESVSHPFQDWVDENPMNGVGMSMQTAKSAVYIPQANVIFYF